MSASIWSPSGNIDVTGAVATRISQSTGIFYPVIFQEYATRALANAAINLVPANAYVIVTTDETYPGSPRIRLQDVGNVYVLDQNLDQLRTDLATPSNGVGADLVANAARSFDSIASLRAFPKPSLIAGESLVAVTTAYAAGIVGGGGQFTWNPTSTLLDDSGLVVNPAGNATSGRWLRIYSGYVDITWFGAVGDGVTDSTVAINRAITSVANIYTGRRSLFIPTGIFIVSATLREATNGGAMDIFGENKYNSVLKAAAGMTVPVLWVGNSNGHGNYRAVFKNFAVTGNTLAGNHGVVLHEAGNSSVQDLRITLCDSGIFFPGMIGSRIRDCELGSNSIHIRGTAPVAGVPSSIDDTTKTASPLTLHNNINVIDGCWLSAGSAGISIVGALTRISGCTFQGVGDDPTKNIIDLTNSYEAFDYGAGPIVDSCWFEGGTYRAMVNVKRTRFAVIKNCFMSGAGANSEAAIIADAAHQILVMHNSIRGGFIATPTEGRLVNSPIYVYANTTFHYRVQENYITNPTGVPYFDGEANPAGAKDFWPVAAGAFIGTATPSVSNSYQFTSITFLSTGRYRCNTSAKFNIANPTMAQYAITVTGTVVAFPVVASQGSGYVEVKFFDAAGLAVNPDGFTVIVYGQPVGQGS